MKLQCSAADHSPAITLSGRLPASCAFLLLPWLLAVSASFAADAIPPVEQRRLELAVNDYLAGKTQLSLRYFAALAASGSEAKIAAVDDFLTKKKLPPLAHLLAQARLKAIHDGSAAKLPRPRAQEVLLELPVLIAGFDNQTGDVLKHPLLNKPLADGLTVNEYDRQIRTVEALAQTIADAQKLAGGLASLAKYVPLADRARLPAEQANLVLRNFTAEAANLQALSRTLEGIEAALRVRRLRRAPLALGRRGAPSERLLAAHTWQEDSARLDAFFDAVKKKGFHADGPQGLAELTDPALPERVHADVERCRALAGTLTKKVGELYTAIDFWLRGRYGEGPELFGLAKAENAVNNQDAAHSIYLPVEPQQPTDPAKQDDQTPAVPHYARRHFHWWAWENQQLANGVFGAAGLMESNLHVIGRQGTMPYIQASPGRRAAWRSFSYTYAAPDEGALQGANLKILARLVGFVEYEQALDHFQRFLKDAKPDELKAADELVRARDDLAIYTNLSRLIEPAGRREAEQPAAAGDTFERRGLEWVIALARLEHQAMLVGFTANPAPLVALLEPPRPGEPYTELLLDGARMHYWAWRKVRDKAKGEFPQGPDLVSEARRAALIIEFLLAAQQRSNGVIGEMPAWQQEVKQFLNEVMKRIQADADLYQLTLIDAPRVVPAPVPPPPGGFNFNH